MLPPVGFNQQPQISRKNQQPPKKVNFGMAVQIPTDLLQNNGVKATKNFFGIKTIEVKNLKEFLNKVKDSAVLEYEKSVRAFKKGYSEGNEKRMQQVALDTVKDLEKKGNGIMVQEKGPYAIYSYEPKDGSFQNKPISQMKKEETEKKLSHLDYEDKIATAIEESTGLKLKRDALKERKPLDERRQELINAETDEKMTKSLQENLKNIETPSKNGSIVVDDENKTNNLVKGIENIEKPNS